MGVVYEAWDKQRAARVALKTLPGLNPHSLYLFKNEFRSLADVNHPNLAALYELFSDQGQWFFTMEYVEGGHFLDHVRPGARYEAAARRETVEPDAPTMAVLPAEAAWSASVNEAGSGDTTQVPGPRPVAAAGCNMERLLPTVEQLASAVMALHNSGIIHRDLKPPNIKVTPEGRVAVLDFGLAAHTGAPGFGHFSSPSGIVGTLAYMSPEQAAGERGTEATDWYAVGVMIFEALTGRRPFEGGSRILLDKQRLEAPPLTGAGLPKEWSAICGGLLERNPAARLGGAELLRMLESLRKRVPQSSLPGMRAPDAARQGERIFVGRETHLALLREGFATLEGGVPSLVFVHGKSGIGKSSLIEHFLTDLARRDNLVILAGRCYERESMPYKAFDSVVDALARHMATLPRHEAGELTPRDAAALARIFPVLRQVESIAFAPQRATPGTQGRADDVDEHDLRRKAFGALRELLARLGDRRRVVIYIDDLQWGDVDSATLLRELLRPPDAPAFLLIGAYRSEYEGRSPALDALLAEIPAEGPGVAGPERRDVLVGPLSRDETRTLAIRLLSERARDIADPELRIEEIARESEGSPYLLQEIAAGSGAPLRAGEDPTLTLDSVLYRRIEQLPEEPRRLLDTVAVSVRPVGEREAFAAAQIGRQDPRVLAALRTARLIRGSGGSGSGEAGEIEPYHDRVRETVLAHLTPAARTAAHLRLALTLEEALDAGGRVEAEAIAIHFEGGAEKAKASRYFAVAAERATAALAFKHAAELYQRALDLSPLAGEDRRGMVVKLAHALGNAGRGPEAARAYREAGRGAREPEIFELERREAYWFASSGHVDEGRETLTKILRRVKVSVPGPLGQLIGTSALVLWLTIRGIGFRERPESEVPRKQLDRIDIYWDVARCFGIIDAPAMLYLTPHWLLLALRAGEADRIVRALGMYATGLSCLPNPMTRSWIPRTLGTAAELAERAGTPYLRAYVRMANAMVAFLLGSWREAAGHFEEAHRFYTKECAGVAWELASVRIFSLWSLLYWGRYKELCQRAPVWSQEGYDRGDLYQAVSIDAGPRPICELIADRPEAAMALLDETLKRWTQRHYNLQLAVSVYIRAWVYLYLGQPAAAWEMLNREWPDVKKNHYLRISGTRQWLHSARGQAALALAGEAGQNGAELLRSAAKDAKSLEGDGTGFSKALAGLIRAGCAAREGNRAEAMALLEKAAAACDASEMSMTAAAARLRLGELQGDDGQEMAEEAERAMRAEGVRNPARLAMVFVSGFSGPEDLAAAGRRW